MPRYIVHTVCTGTIRETWRVASTRELDDDEVEAALSGRVEDATPEWLLDETDDEEDRVVTAIEVEDEPDTLLFCAPFAGAPQNAEAVNRFYRFMDADANWENNAIQFPRLLAELRAVGLTEAQYATLAEAMDLTQEQIDSVLERAEAVWQDIKART